MHRPPAVILAAAIGVLCASFAAAQPPRDARPLENIKVLTGWSGTEVRDEMRKMADAIGVKCDHCHVQGNFPSDEKRAKHTARRMLQMTMALNAESFPTHEVKAGESKLGRVTCYTCHQGAAVPKQSASTGAPH